MTKLILLATYWNESEWIESSLKQIEALNPDLVILCDGCFDPSIKNYSTDITREKLKEYVNNHNNSILFEAVRKPKLSGLSYILRRGLSKKVSFSLFYLVFKHLLRTNVYRVNQAVTFNMMLDEAISIVSESNKANDDIWFMTIDADQFYSDEMIEKVANRTIFNTKSSLITAKELTFNESFSSLNDEYELRVWNNMPHKFYDYTLILPTRDISYIERFKVSKYFESLPTISAGNYYHYKFRSDMKRYNDGYNLGDRKQPAGNRSKDIKPFSGEHPSIIKNLIKTRN